MKIERIFLRNFLIIKKSDIVPAKGLTSITGETGSGKSLFVSALKMIRGERGDKNIVGKWGDFAEVSAEITIEKGDVQLKKNIEDSPVVLETPDRIIVKRLLGSKNGCYVDGSPVALSVLHNILSDQIEIGSQFENRELFKKDYRTAVVDRIAGNEKDLAEYRKIYALIRQTEGEIKELEKKDDPVRRDYLEFQINEIEKLQTYENEDEELAGKINYFENKSRINELSGEITSLLDEASGSLSKCASSAEKLASLIDMEEFRERMKSLSIDAEDLSRSSCVISRKDEFEFEEIENIKLRYDELSRLLMKHGVSSSGKLLRKESEMNEELNEINKVPEKIDSLSGDLEKYKKEAEDIALAIRKKRKDATKVLEDKVLKYLDKFAMGGVRFSVVVLPLDDFSENGLDIVEFKVNTIGTDDMHSVTSLSGGELSRLLLAMKLLDEESGKVLLFDEIDSSIGGETAKNAAAEMLENSKRNQIMTVTHFPQTASAGECHILVEKDTSGNDVTAHIKVLSKDERIRELARMMGDGANKDLLLTAEKMLGERNVS